MGKNKTMTSFIRISAFRDLQSLTGFRNDACLFSFVVCAVIYSPNAWTNFIKLVCFGHIWESCIHFVDNSKNKQKNKHTVQE